MRRAVRIPFIGHEDEKNGTVDLEGHLPQQVGDGRVGGETQGSRGHQVADVVGSASLLRDTPTVTAHTTTRPPTMSLTFTCDWVESLKGLDAYPKVGLSLTRMRGLPVALRMRMSMVGLWERRQENERAGGRESRECGGRGTGATSTLSASSGERTGRRGQRTGAEGRSRSSPRCYLLHAREQDERCSHTSVEQKQKHRPSEQSNVPNLS